MLYWRIALLAAGMAQMATAGTTLHSKIPANLTLVNITQFYPSDMGCPVMLVAAHYLELGCTPTEFRNASFFNCPREFRCPAVLNRPTTECLYQGRSYKVDEKIPKSAMHVRCKHSCICKITEPGIPSFVCKTRKCATPPRPGCRKIFYSDMQCCPKYICDPPAAGHDTCQYKNHTFQLGEVVDGTFNGTRCLCKPGFTGKLGPAFCQRPSCGIELEHIGSLRHGCSPVYNVNMTALNVGADALMIILDFLRDRLADVCPIDWVCPSEDDVVVPLTSMAPEIPIVDTQLNCRFGSNDMAMLDLAMTPEQPDGSCTMCVCMVPPNLLCMIKPSCWTF